jgi:hypothetical protein
MTARHPPGALIVRFQEGLGAATAGHAIITWRGEWVQCCTPGLGPAEYYECYIATCIPVFSPETGHRDEEQRSYHDDFRLLPSRVYARAVVRGDRPGNREGG